MVNQVAQQDACQTFASLPTVVHLKDKNKLYFRPVLLSHKQIYFSLLSVIILISSEEGSAEHPKLPDQHMSISINTLEANRIQYEQKQVLLNTTHDLRDTENIFTLTTSNMCDECMHMSVNIHMHMHSIIRIPVNSAVIFQSF